MPEKTKEKENRLPTEPEEKESRPPENKEIGTDGDWSEDQRDKSYYYDDGYGYEIYDPDSDEDDDD